MSVPLDSLPSGSGGGIRTGTYSGRQAGEGVRSWAVESVQRAGPGGSLGVAVRVFTPTSVLRL